MRITFVDNLLVTERGGESCYDLQPNLGLLSLISVAQGGGHHCQLIDPKLELHAGRLHLDATLYERLARRILETRPDVVGLTSLGCNFVCTVKVARHLKQQAPFTPILLGGPHATILHQAILHRFPQFDLIARHESETVLLSVLNAVGSPTLLQDIPGITYRADDRIVVNPGRPTIDDLDLLPAADYSHYPIRELGLLSLRVEAGRGCPYECTFCSTASFFGRRYRLKSVARLVAELEELRSQFGISSFSLTHDLFTINKTKVKEFCEAVHDRGFEWSCSARTDCVDVDLLALMRRAGCSAIYYGIETGSERMQRVVRKKLRLGGSRPIIDETLRLGIATTISFITGYPDEAEHDQDETLDYIGSCYEHESAALNIQLHLLTPEPGTALAAAHAGELLYDAHISDFNFPTLDDDDKDILRGDPNIFVNHHYFPTSIERRRNIFVTEILPLLHALGFPILAQILDRFDGRLSLFLGDLMRWERGKTPSRDFYALLREFFQETFGAADPLTALVRYATIGARLLESVGCLPEYGSSPSPLSANLLRLSSGAILLPDLPDVPAMLDALAEARRCGRPYALPIGAGEHYDWLITVAPGSRRSLRNFRLDRLGAEVVNFLSHPRTVEQCRSRFSDAVASDEIDGFLKQLGTHGLLEFVTPQPSC